MPIFNVKVILETTIVVFADNEDHAYDVAYETAIEVIDTERPDPCVCVTGEVMSVHHLRDAWDEDCIPYGGDGNTRLRDILAKKETQ
jgi:hypothetical protein